MSVSSRRQLPKAEKDVVFALDAHMDRMETL